MADEPTTTATVTETQTGEPKETETSQTEMVPKSKFDDALELLRQNQVTLQALEGDRQRVAAESQRHNAPLPTTEADLLRTLAAELGGNVPESEIRPYMHIVNRILEQQSGPILQMMNGLAEQLSGVRARQTFGDYADFSDDIDKERDDSQRFRNRWLGHDEAYHVVKGRRLPQLLQAERDRLAAETAGGGSPGADLGTVTKAGPSATKSTRTPSPDELATMSAEDRLKLLEDMGGF